MKWSEKAWAQALPVYSDIIDMPFIKELAAGTLDVEKFKYYLQQDAHYLEYFARVLAIIAAKARDVDTMLDFIRFSEGAVVVERSLHDSYFKDYNLTCRVPMSPACHHYVHYLQSTVYMADSAVGMAAVLPCFWIYKKVGDHILSIANIENNPYQNWIATYAGEAFGLLVDKAIAICDTIADKATPEQQQLMSEAFLSASRLEYLFWDSAYRLEKWNR
ncbi:MAG: thiaminase II [Flavobacterium psychrophilum]|nr:MAG: thiaminase II [Flavobacterium psychrophilum]